MFAGMLSWSALCRNSVCECQPGNPSLCKCHKFIPSWRVLQGPPKILAMGSGRGAACCQQAWCSARAGRGNRALCAFPSLLSPQTSSPRGVSLRLRCLSGSKSKRVMGVPGSPPGVCLLSEVNTTHQRWACTPERGHNPFCHSCTLFSSELLSDFHFTPASCQAGLC